MDWLVLAAVVSGVLALLLVPGRFLYRPRSNHSEEINYPAWFIVSTALFCLVALSWGNISGLVQAQDEFSFAIFACSLLGIILYALRMLLLFARNRSKNDVKKVGQKD